MRALLCVLLAGCASSTSSAPRPAIIVHRGGEPDGTVEGCLNSLNDGLTFLELDVRLTKDGEAVILHDPTVDRTTDGTGPIEDLTLREAQALGIPSVAEVLKAVGERGTVLLELKVPTASLSVLAAIQAQKAEHRAVVRTRDPLLLSSLRSHGVLVGTMSADPPDGVYATTPPDNAAVTPALVARLHARKIRVWATNTNDPAVMRRLIAAGVDGIITDRPDLLRAELSR